MTQEDKELLLKDLCARLPYGVKGIVEDGIKITTPSEWPVEKSIEFSMRYMVIKNGWKPYLFPMSSMTDEQRKELEELYLGYYVTCQDIDDDGYIWDEKVFEMFPGTETDDWLNAHHFDYRGLIDKGLAIDATGLNIY